MNLAAVFHRPMSEYAFAMDENTYVFRLRAQRGDLKRCTLHYADRAAMGPLPPRRKRIARSSTPTQVRFTRLFQFSIDVPPLSGWKNGCRKASFAAVSFSIPAFSTFFCWAAPP